ncbi:MAG: hypothetical protein WB791_09775, partial [Waddliaceae bacterium]
MKKKVFIFLLLFAVLLSALFWQQIGGSFVKLCVHGFCRYRLGTEVHAKEIYYKEGYWIVEKPTLERNGAYLSASRLLLGIGIHPLKREFNLEIIVDDSLIELRDAPSHLKEVITVTKNFPSWLLKLNSSMKIDHGTLSWLEPLDQSAVEQTAAFDFSAESNSQDVKGRFRLMLDDGEVSKNCFELHVAKEEEHSYLAELVFHDVDCQKLYGLYAVFGEEIRGWDVRKGEIDGKINVIFAQQSPPCISGTATLNDLAFAQEQMKIFGQIGQAKIDVSVDRRDQNTPSFKGNVEIVKDASFVLHRDGVPYWEVKQVAGGVDFLENEEVKVMIEGTCQHHQHAFGLLIDGSGRFQIDKQTSLNLALHLTDENHNEALARFVTRQFGGECNSAEIELVNVGTKEFAFIQEALTPYFPKCSLFRMEKGSVDASGVAYLQGFQLTAITLDQLTACDLQFTFDPWELCCRVGESSGNFSIDLTNPNVFETIDANFSIQRGHVRSLGFNGNRWHFHDICTDLVLRKGMIQKSEMTGEFFGLTGTLVVDWLSREEAMQLNFSGDTDKFAAYLPDVIGNGIRKSLHGHRVRLVASMAMESFAAKITGKMSVEGGADAAVETIDFGFELEKSSEKLWKQWPANDLARAYWENVGLEAMQAVIPPIASPTVLLETNWIQSESGIAGLVVRKGWFLAKDLPLEKYLSSFLLSDDNMRLTGRGDFQGFFDHCRMGVEYVGRDVELDNPRFTIRAGSIRRLNDREQRKNIGAVHYFDFKKGTHFGTLPLVDASYHEKNSDLLFTDIGGIVTFEGKHIHFSEIETKCQGLSLAGTIDVNFDFPQKETYEIDIRSRKLRGKVSQLQRILSHIHEDPTFLDLPLEGDLCYRENGGYLLFAFQPGDYQVQARAEGSLTHGNLAFDAVPATVRDLSLDFAYDYQKSLLDFSSIQGTLQMGDNDDQEEYFLAGEYIRFDDFSGNIGAFDVRVGDQTRDFARFSGRTVPETSPKGSSLIAFHLDNDLTHVGDIHPKTFRLALKDGTDVDQFHLSFHARLDAL